MKNLIKQYSDTQRVKFYKDLAKYYDPSAIESLYYVATNEMKLLPEKIVPRDITNVPFPTMGMKMLSEDRELQEYFPELMMKDGIASAYKYFVDQYNVFYKENSEEGGYSFNHAMQCITFANSEFVKIFADVEKYLRVTILPEWSRDLFNVNDKERREHNFLVSFSNNFTADSSNYPVVSCSLINKTLTQTYAERTIGYLYDLENSDALVGMWLGDYGTLIRKVGINTVQQYALALAGCRFVNENEMQYGPMIAYSICYPMQYLVEHTSEYNEIILDSHKAKPKALFVLRSEYRRNEPYYEGKAIDKKLPLVIYDTKSDKVEVIDGTK